MTTLSKSLRLGHDITVFDTAKGIYRCLKSSGRMSRIHVLLYFGITACIADETRAAAYSPECESIILQLVRAVA